MSIPDTHITGFEGDDNSMITLSLASNTELTSVVFADNPSLETVNLKNGNNTAITDFQGSNCPQLRFVCVDDVPFAEANFTDIDPQVDFVDDCQLLSNADISEPFQVRLYPNPVSNQLTISYSKQMDYLGARVYSLQGAELVSTTQSQIDMSGMAVGVYFVQVRTSAGISIQKVVKI